MVQTRKMELHEGVIIIAVVAVSSVIFYKVYRFAMRGKTYEEAIAEQRKLPLEHLLLGRSGKDKNKDKKQKKVGKKVKEKPSEKEKSEHSTKVNVASKVDSTSKNPVSAINKADVTLKASNNTAPSKINVANPNVHLEKHRAVEFGKPEAEVVDDQAIVQQDENKVKKKKKADKGILLNKDEVSPVDVRAVKDEPSSPFTINHFEEKKPKDEFLKRKCSEVSSTAASAEPEPEDIQVDLRSEVVTSTVIAAPQEIKRKKKKSDLLTLQQMGSVALLVYL
ncbi:hypothetical protein J437_LFUL005167 [Ladona fulva]|uniref:Uncharacterized protein n=1 Tax=Ladona fulva TaxID=123851 RepID=A0A8K0KNV3_LADFU|nr:hypothetical protein J437_LFUL005167 [Ladona fulva]